MAPGARPKEEYVAEPPLLPAWVNPALDRFMVVNKKMYGSYFRSWAESKVDLPAGGVFARINGITPTSKQNYATAQSGLSPTCTLSGIPIFTTVIIHVRHL
jgi:hypothetical protein